MPTEIYAKINSPQLVMGAEILRDYAEQIGGSHGKSKNLRVIDFGCGTGETTKLMANGNPFAKFSCQVESLIGMDLSQDMVDYCAKHYKAEKNMTFQQFDVMNVAERTRFENENKEQLDVITSFFAIHWVREQTDALKFFRSMLKQDTGRMMISININNPADELVVKVFDKLKANYPANMKGIECKSTGYRFNDEAQWQTKVTKSGSILPQDYEKLLKSLGFELLVSNETKSPLTKEERAAFAKRPYFQSKVMSSYRDEFDSQEKFETFKKIFLETLEGILSSDEEVDFRHLTVIVRKP